MRTAAFVTRAKTIRGGRNAAAGLVAATSKVEERLEELWEETQDVDDERYVEVRAILDILQSHQPRKPS